MKFIKAKRIVKVGLESWKYFGFDITKAKISCIIHDESLSSVQRKNEVVLAYLQKQFALLLDQYKDQEDYQIGISCEQAPIWVFWWQGRDTMPEVVRLCQKSKEDYKGNHPVILLDQTNIKEYVQFPDFIWESFYANKIRVQHLADMIRVQLISKYGGLWLDASVYCARKIPDEFFTFPVYSIKGIPNPYYISNNEWTTFVIGGKPGNVLCRFLNDFFIEYSKTGKPFVDYFLLDEAIALAYRNISAVKKELDLIPCSMETCYWLERVIDEKLTEEILNELRGQQQPFYKIAWNRLDGFNKSADSVYTYLMEKHFE